MPATYACRNPYEIQVNTKGLQRVQLPRRHAKGRNPYEIQVNTKVQYFFGRNIGVQAAGRNPYEIQVNTKL